MRDLLPVGSRIFGVSIFSAVLAACSTTPVPEKDPRLFGQENVNPFIPLISLLGENPVTVDVFSSFEDSGATALSAEDGDIPSSQIQVSGSVDTSHLGTYEILYSVKDSKNRVGQAKRIVNVVDRAKPMIDVLTNQTVTLERRGYGNPAAPDYDLAGDGRAGVTATDNYDGNLATAMTLQAAINRNQEGDYPILYNVVDSSGNAADPKIRMIQVRDTIPPGVSIGNFDRGSIGYNDTATINVTFEDAAMIADPFTTKVQLVLVGGGTTPVCEISSQTNGMVRTISITHCQGVGSVKLKVLSGAAQDATTLPGPNLTPEVIGSSVLNISNPAPVVMIADPVPSIIRSGTGSGTVANFAVTYSLPINGSADPLESSDVEVSVVSGNPSCATPSIQSPSSQTPTIQLFSCNGNGQLKIRVKANAVRSQSGGIYNPVSDYSGLLTVDNTAPTVQLGTPVPASGSAVSSATNITIPYTITEAVGLVTSGPNSVIDPSEVSISPSGINCANKSVTATQIQLSNCSGINTTFTVSVNAGAVQDLAGNGSAASTGNPSFVLDTTGPAVTSFSAWTPIGPIRSTGSSYIDINFNEDLDPGDPLTVAELGYGASGSLGCNVTIGPVTGPRVRRVNISNCSGNGIFQIRVNANAVKDSLGNFNLQSNLSGGITIDNQGPGITIQNPSFNPGLQSGYMVSNSVANFGVSFDEMINPGNPLELSDLQVSLVNQAPETLNPPTFDCGTQINGSVQSPNVRVQCGGSAGLGGEGTYRFQVKANSVQDVAGNMNANPSNLSVLLNVDTLGPRATLGAPSAVLVNGTSSSAIVVSYTDAHLQSVFLNSSGVAFQTTGTANANKSVQCGSGAGLPSNQCRITLNSFSGNGTIQVVVNSNTAVDQAGNGSSASAPSSAITVDTQAPDIRFDPGTDPFNVALCSTARNYRTDGIQVCTQAGGACVPDTTAALTIDSENVNLLASSGYTGGPSDYQITFKATDAAGNISFKTRAVHVDGMLESTFFHFGIADQDGLLGDASQIRTTIANDNSPKNFALCGDIDFAGYGPRRPLGHPTSGGMVRSFKGIFDGRGYTLDHITIVSTINNQPAGLFANLNVFGTGPDKGIIRNLKLRNISVTSTNDQVGGLVGINRGRISRVSLVGASTVNGKSKTGGLVGESQDNSKISESFSIAVVTAMNNSSDVGGLVGVSSGDIADSFVVPPAASANVTGTNITNIGGLVGRLAGGGTIETSYAVAYGLCGATGMTEQGGLVGFVDGGSTAVSDSFWDKEVAAQSAMDPLCDETAPYGISRSTAEMQDPMTYPPTWLATIWRLQANYYPDLLWFPLF